MDSEFIPLVPRSSGSAASSPAQPAASSLARANAGFEPMALSAMAAQPASCNAGQPCISLQRVDGVVTRIRVQCGCGQVIELDCEYEPQAAPATLPAPSAGQIRPAQRESFAEPSRQAVGAKAELPQPGAGTSSA